MDCYFEAWHNCSVTDVEDFAEGAHHLKVEESQASRGAQPFAAVFAAIHAGSAAINSSSADAYGGRR
eukprot:584425-Rhodomonas_salina.1